MSGDPSLTILNPNDMTAETYQKLKEKCKEVYEKNPGNRCAKYAIDYLDSEEGKSLSNEGTFSIKNLLSQLLLDSLALLR